MAYRIDYVPSAIQQLRSLTAREQSMVLDAVDEQLMLEPTVATRNRKPMRPGGPAPWELRVGHLRVFYDVTPLPPKTDEPFEGIVLVIAIGVKEGNRLWIGDEEWHP